MSLASESSKTVLWSSSCIIKLGTVTASDMVMHHVFIILTLTFIQSHTDHNHENEKCSIISKTVQAIPIQFRCEDSPTNGLNNAFSVRWPCSSLKATTASQTWPMFNLYNNRYIIISSRYLSYGIQTWHDGRRVHVISAHAGLDDLDLDSRSSWVGKGKHLHLSSYYA